MDKEPEKLQWNMRDGEEEMKNHSTEEDESVASLITVAAAYSARVT